MWPCSQSLTCPEGKTGSSGHFASTWLCCWCLALVHRWRRTPVHQPTGQGDSPSTRVSAWELPGNIINLLLTTQANASTQGHLKYHGQCHPAASLTPQAGSSFRETSTNTKVELFETQALTCGRAVCLVQTLWSPSKKQLYGAWFGV